jgi:hypothetical protein
VREERGQVREVERISRILQVRGKGVRFLRGRKRDVEAFTVAG